LAINEMINITKIYFIGTEYKLVNKVLDRISKISFGSNEENTNKNN
jgi:nusB family